MQLDGLPLTAAGPEPRPGVVSLHDAFTAADDWLILRTTRRTVNDLMRQYDVSAVWRPAQLRVVVPTQIGEGWWLRAYDESLQPILDLWPNNSRGYTTRGGAEVLAGGLVMSRERPGASRRG